MKRRFYESAIALLEGGSGRLSSSLRQRINAELDKIGPYFNSISDANNKIAMVLTKYGIELTDVMSGDLFMGKKGTRVFDVNWISTGKDPFTPGEDIPNTGLFYAWHRMERGVEVLCYLSS